MDYLIEIENENSERYSFYVYVVTELVGKILLGEHHQKFDKGIRLAAKDIQDHRSQITGANKL